MNFEFLKSWVGFLGSLFIGSVGFLEKFSVLCNLVFVILGCIGLVYSIKLTIKKLRYYDKDK